MSSHKRVAILFFDNWLPYSPTTLNLYDQLRERFQVTIFLPSKKHGTTENLGTRNVVYLNEKSSSILDIVSFLVYRIVTRGSRLGYEVYLRTRRLKKALTSFAPDHVIAVDHAALLLAANAWKGKLHLLSLEIDDPEPTRALAKHLNSVLIESDIRLRYLFGETQTPTVFLLPNAPVFKPLEKPHTLPEHLVFCGTTLARFGLYSCLRFLSHYPGYTLTIKGNILKQFNDNALMVFQELFDDGRVKLDPEYMFDDELNVFLSHFRIGFSLYDLRYSHKQDFHYRHVQSGKMYRYFSCGVPVIANNLPGLSPVQEFGAGVLIDRMTPEAIYEAIQSIEADYDSYVKNCFTAARHFDFKKYAGPVIDYFQTS